MAPSALRSDQQPQEAGAPATGSAAELQPAAAVAGATAAASDGTGADVQRGGYEDIIPPVRHRPPPGSQAETGPRWGLAFGWLLFFALVGGVVGGGWHFREQVVAQVPETARLYQLLGVPLDQAGPTFVLDWKLAIRNEASGPTVTLNGQVINATEASLPAPQLAVVLLNTQGSQIDSWAVEVEGGPIAPGEARDFMTSGPWPQAAKEVSVRLLQ